MTQLDKEFVDRFAHAFATEMFNRLTKGPCPNCGRSAASHQELTVIRQWMNDNDIVEAMRAAAPLRKVADGMPFNEDGERVRSKTA